MSEVTYKDLLDQKVEGKETKATESMLRNAEEIIEETIKWHEDIVIISDKDADGITAAKIMSEFVKAVSDKKPTVVIGDRFDGKYGIPDINKLPLKNHTCVICLDIGSTERTKLDEIERITGEKAIIIDHHEISEDMKTYPTLLNFTGRKNAPDYCTAGLTKRLFDFLYEKRCGSINDKYPHMKATVDVFGCIGTIADCVSVNNPHDLNSSIIMEGFKFLSSSHTDICKKLEPAAGMFLEQTGIFDRKYITTEFMQYNVVPLLNACGRLEKGGSQYTFDTFYECTYEEASALEHIDHLFEINRQRKEVKQQVLNSYAIKEFKEEVIRGEKKIAVYVNENIPQGITGLVASSLAEELNVPAVVITLDASGNYIASGRNREGFPGLYEMCQRAVKDTILLTANTSNEKSELERLLKIERFKDAHVLAFGGHTSAVGFTMDPVYLNNFKEILEKAYMGIEPAKIEKTVLMENKLTPDMLYALEPFGPDYMQPQVKMQAIVEKKRNLKNRSDWASFSANGYKFTTFNCGDKIQDGDVINVCGEASINEYKGKCGIQVQFSYIDFERILTAEQEERG